MFEEKQVKMKNTIAKKLVLSLTSVSVLTALLLALVPFHPSAVADAQLQWKIQEDRVERLTVSKKDKFKGDSLSVDEVMKAGNSRKTGVATTKKADAGKQGFAIFNVEFLTEKDRTSFVVPEGAKLLTGVGAFGDYFVATIAAQNAIRNSPKVRAMEYASFVDVPPPPPVGEPVAGGRPGDPPDTIVRGGYRSLTGKNVIIAVVDTGIDFRHPDFIKTDASGKKVSRILALWDTTMPFQKGRGSEAPYSYPNKTSIGTMFTRDQLTAELNKTVQTIPATDLDGHGTACASIAAGNGNADKLAGGLKRPDTVGVAPDADIIGIRIDQGDDSDGLENAWVLNAANEWLDKTFPKQSIVVSGSFGGHRGAHDGSRIAERHLNARFPLDKIGRSIVMAAGNDGTRGMHAGEKFGDKPNAKVFGWNAPAEGGEITIYFDAKGDTDVLMLAPATAETKAGKPVWGRNPITRQWFVTVNVTGIGGIFVWNESGAEMSYDAYIINGKFLPLYSKPEKIVSSPGTAENVITVGSYNWNDGFFDSSLKGELGIMPSAGCETDPIRIKSISCYSSQGPSRNGTVKPEIVAPGQWFNAALARNKGVAVEWDNGIDTTGNYAAMNGTSAATPYVAGIVALMYEKKPGLKLGEIRDLLTRNTSRDPFTTATLPNSVWGFGKLDFDAVTKIMNSL